MSCDRCGKEIRRTPSRIARGTRYCSRRCYLRSTAETTIERLVREDLERRDLEFAQEVQVGRFTLDFLVDDLAVEADGSYWHGRRPETDARKDRAVAAAGLRLVRLGEAEIMDGSFAVRLDAALCGRDGESSASAPISPEALRVAAEVG